MDRQPSSVRLEKIEIKLAFLEDFLNRLQEEVTGRNAAMDRLIAENAAIKERLLAISQSLEEMPDRKPPHY
ncbi:MAG: SlyX family protein [Treponema sp.]|jgi:SlyX protein|nr:SlyX family protein [Treponema sp.]